MEKKLFLDDFYNMTVSQLVKIPKKEVRKKLNQARLIERCLESLLDQDFRVKPEHNLNQNNQNEEINHDYY